MTVELPAGRWTDDLGAEHVGPKTLTLRDVPLGRLPRFRREAAARDAAKRPSRTSAAPSLEAGFRNPPPAARPHTWYHMMNGKASPTGRHTFTAWKHWDKDDKLQPSGILGPAVLRVR